jgi:hypothetical protein
MTDLNTFLPSGWIMDQAFDINDNGQIICNGSNPEGKGGAFILTPIPEPIANAGNDITAYADWTEKVLVTLDGSESSDEDGDALTYLWTWSINGVDYEAEGVNPTIELPVGEHIITLVVNDGQADSQPDELTVTVTAMLNAKLNLVPKVINRKSNGGIIMAMLRLPVGIQANNIDMNYQMVLQPGNIPCCMKMVRVTGKNCIMLFGVFDQQKVLSVIIDNGPVDLTIEGKLNSGQYFGGTDQITIIEPGKKK